MLRALRALRCVLLAVLLSVHLEVVVDVRRNRRAGAVQPMVKLELELGLAPRA